MYYEPYRGKRRRGVRRRIGCLAALIRLVLLICLIAAAVGFLSTGMLDAYLRIPDLQRLSGNRDLPSTAVNILILGVDSAKQGAQRSDTMMIASVMQDGGLKLTSLMRDTMVDMGEHGAQKLNAAYAYGGADGAMRAVNEAFGMNITRYAAVDFAGFAAVIDALGGVDVNVTQAEAEAMNKTAKPQYALHTFGERTHLTGAQALRFARIRKLDSDYARARRQRALLAAALGKLRSTANPVTLWRVAAEGMQAVDTNIGIPQLLALALRVAINGEIDAYRVPCDGTFESGTVDGVWSIRANLAQNRALLYDFVYGE